MLPQTALESKEEDAGIVKRKDQDETTDDNRQETPTTSVTTTATTSCDSQLPAPVMTSWIIVSIATSLFFICIVVFEIWKKMAQDLEDKSILVGHESQKLAIPENKSECHVNKTEGTDVRNKNEKNSDAECTDEDTPLIGNEDRLCSTKKIEEIKEQDLAEFPSEDNVEKTMCAADHRHLETENSDVLGSSPATQHVVSQSNLEDLKVLPSCDATSGTLKTCVKAGCPMEASTDTGVNNPDELVTFNDNMPILDKTEMCLQHSKQKTVDNGIVSVQLGPSFTGNLNINVGATAMCEDLRSEEMTTKLREPQKKFVAENVHVTYQNYVSEHSVTINCMQRKSSDNLAMSGTLEAVSPSLQYLTEINQPKDTVNGSLLSKYNDMFMFPLDNDVAVVNKSELPSQINTKPKKKLLQINADSEFSKSLDSQKKILEKGCKLLETKPFKSSLRSSGSDGCLKKSVHFPEDIRNIRTVHKYDSFDESIWLKIDRDKTEEETNNVKD